MITSSNITINSERKLDFLPYMKSLYLKKVVDYRKICPKPASDLIQRGKKILQNEVETTMYMAFYGAHHITKLISAFESIDQNTLKDKSISIYDWGCGQGIGTLVLLEYFQTKKIILNLRNINFIEPSKISLQLSEKYLNDLLENYKLNKPGLKCINKDFNSLSSVYFSEDSAEISIHILSNILDVENYDLSNLFRCIESTKGNQNLFICVGPNYSDSIIKMDCFRNLFSHKFTIQNILNRSQVYNINAYSYLSGTFRPVQVKSIEKVFQLN